jgi:hypothetical protein
MASAGYDPRDMASMFKTIEKQGGPGGPQWLSDHPNPGDRAAYITKEAQSLRVVNPVGDSPAFTQIQARLKQMSPAPTTEQATRTASGRPTASSAAIRAPTGRVPPPRRVFALPEGDLFKVSVASNWRELPGQNSVTFARWRARPDKRPSVFARREPRLRPGKNRNPRHRPPSWSNRLRRQTQGSA